MLPETHANIGIVLPLAEKRGGAEQAFRDFLRGTPETDRERFRLLFLCDGPMVEESRELGYRSNVIEAGRLRQAFRFLRTVWRVHRWIRRNELGVVFAWMSKAHLYTSLPARISGARAAWFQFDVFSGSWVDRINAILPTDLVLCCSRAGADAQLAAFPKMRAVPVHLAVDHDRFNRSTCGTAMNSRRQLGLNPDLPMVVLVARLERWKGVHVFIDAALRLLGDASSLQFAVVGSEHPLDPAYAQELRETVRSSPWADRILLAGHQTNVPLWMCAADVVVHTSVKPEPFGIVVLEAMALGRPLIAAAAGGPLEVVSDGEDAILIEPGDPEKLATAIRNLLANEEKRTRIGEAGAVTAAGYTPQRFAEQVTRVLDALHRQVVGT